jgi:hypothetical protein
VIIPAHSPALDLEPGQWVRVSEEEAERKGKGVFTFLFRPAESVSASLQTDGHHRDDLTNDHGDRLAQTNLDILSARADGDIIDAGSMLSHCEVEKRLASSSLC